MQHGTRTEDEPLLPRAGERPLLARCLLYFSGGQLCTALFVSFSMHLARLNLFKVWVDLAMNTLQLDVLYTLGTFLSVLAAVFWTISLFTTGIGCSGRTCFVAAIFGATTLAWSSLLRLAQAHGLEITCPRNHQQAHSKICVGFARSAFTVWLWTPVGIFQELQRTLQQPWLFFAESVQAARHTQLAWEGREVFIGTVFWLSSVFCLCMIPSLLHARVFTEHPSRAHWLPIFFCTFMTVLSTYMAFLFTTEPCQWFWTFLASPYIKLHTAAVGPQHPVKTRVDLQDEPKPLFAEEWLCMFACIWIFLRTIYLVTITQLEQWGAKQRFEESLRHAIAHPFRADLERGFADDVRPAAEAALWSVRPEDRKADADSLQTMEALMVEDATTESIITSLVEPNLFGVDLETARQPAVGLQLRRDALIAERRRALIEQAGGDAALPSLLCVRVRRSHLLEDTWRIMIERPVPELLAPSIMVEFEGESGVDVGGVTRDWFDSVARALSDETDVVEGLLALANDGTLLPRTVALARPEDPAGAKEQQTREDSEDEVARLRALLAAGRFVALAVLTARPLPLSLGSVVCKYILQRPVGMDDVRRLDPDFYRCRVEAILKPGGVAEMEEALGLGQPLTYISAPTERQLEPEELVEGGLERAVTEENKVEYVQLLCEAYLCGGIRRELRCLLQGFWDLLPLEVLQDMNLSPQELSVLIAGIRDLDPHEWRRHSVDANLFFTSTTVEASNTRQVLDWFWEIVHDDFTPEQRCLLLHFATGSSRLPPGGFPELQPAFSVEVTGSSSAVHLPHAHTCINRLVLHKYPSKALLHEKLLLALSSEGFAFA